MCIPSFEQLQLLFQSLIRWSEIVKVQEQKHQITSSPNCSYLCNSSQQHLSILILNRICSYLKHVKWNESEYIQKGCQNHIHILRSCILSSYIKVKQAALRALRYYMINDLVLVFYIRLSIPQLLTSHLAYNFSDSEGQGMRVSGLRLIRKWLSLIASGNTSIQIPFCFVSFLVASAAIPRSIYMYKFTMTQRKQLEICWKLECISTLRDISFLCTTLFLKAEGLSALIDATTNPLIYYLDKNQSVLLQIATNELLLRPEYMLSSNQLVLANLSKCSRFDECKPSFSSKKNFGEVCIHVFYNNWLSEFSQFFKVATNILSRQNHHDTTIDKKTYKNFDLKKQQIALLRYTDDVEYYLVSFSILIMCTSLSGLMALMQNPCDLSQLAELLKNPLKPLQHLRLIRFFHAFLSCCMGHGGSRISPYDILQMRQSANLYSNAPKSVHEISSHCGSNVVCDLENFKNLNECYNSEYTSHDFQLHFQSANNTNVHKKVCTNTPRIFQKNSQSIEENVPYQQQRRLLRGDVSQAHISFALRLLFWIQLPCALSHLCGRLSTDSVQDRWNDQGETLLKVKREAEYLLAALSWISSTVLPYQFLHSYMMKDIFDHIQSSNDTGYSTRIDAILCPFDVMFGFQPSFPKKYSNDGCIELSNQLESIIILQRSILFQENSIKKTSNQILCKAISASEDQQNSEQFLHSEPERDIDIVMLLLRSYAATSYASQIQALIRRLSTYSVITPYQPTRGRSLLAETNALLHQTGVNQSPKIYENWDFQAILSFLAGPLRTRGQLLMKFPDVQLFLNRLLLFYSPFGGAYYRLLWNRKNLMLATIGIQLLCTLQCFINHKCRENVTSTTNVLFKFISDLKHYFSKMVLSCKKQTNKIVRRKALYCSTLINSIPKCYRTKCEGFTNSTFISPVFINGYLGLPSICRMPLSDGSMESNENICTKRFAYDVNSNYRKSYSLSHSNINDSAIFSYQREVLRNSVSTDKPFIAGTKVSILKGVFLKNNLAKVVGNTVGLHNGLKHNSLSALVEKQKKKDFKGRMNLEYAAFFGMLNLSTNGRLLLLKAGFFYTLSEMVTHSKLDYFSARFISYINLDSSFGRLIFVDILKRGSKYLKLCVIQYLDWMATSDQMRFQIQKPVHADTLFSHFQELIQFKSVVSRFLHRRRYEAFPKFEDKQGNKHKCENELKRTVFGNRNNTFSLLNPLLHHVVSHEFLEELDRCCISPIWQWVMDLLFDFSSSWHICKILCQMSQNVIAKICTHGRSTHLHLLSHWYYSFKADGKSSNSDYNTPLIPWSFDLYLQLLRSDEGVNCLSQQGWLNHFFEKALYLIHQQQLQDIISKKEGGIKSSAHATAIDLMLRKAFRKVLNNNSLGKHVGHPAEDDCILFDSTEINCIGSNDDTHLGVSPPRIPTTQVWLLKKSKFSATKKRSRIASQSNSMLKWHLSFLLNELKNLSRNSLDDVDAMSKCCDFEFDPFSILGDDHYFAYKNNAAWLYQLPWRINVQLVSFKNNHIDSESCKTPITISTVNGTDTEQPIDAKILSDKKTLQNCVIIWQRHIACHALRKTSPLFLQNMKEMSILNFQKEPSCFKNARGSEFSVTMHSTSKSGIEAMFECSCFALQPSLQSRSCSSISTKSTGDKQNKASFNLLQDCPCGGSLSSFTDSGEQSSCVFLTGICNFELLNNSFSTSDTQNELFLRVSVSIGEEYFNIDGFPSLEGTHWINISLMNLVNAFDSSSDQIHSNASFSTKTKAGCAHEVNQKSSFYSITIEHFKLTFHLTKLDPSLGSTFHQNLPNDPYNKCSHNLDFNTITLQKCQISIRLVGVETILESLPKSSAVHIPDNILSYLGKTKAGCQFLKNSPVFLKYAEIVKNQERFDTQALREAFLGLGSIASSELGYRMLHELGLLQLVVDTAYKHCSVLVREAAIYSLVMASNSNAMLLNSKNHLWDINVPGPPFEHFHEFMKNINLSRCDCQKKTSFACTDLNTQKMIPRKYCGPSHSKSNSGYSNDIFKDTMRHQLNLSAENTSDNDSDYLSCNSESDSSWPTTEIHFHDANLSKNLLASTISKRKKPEVLNVTPDEYRCFEQKHREALDLIASLPNTISFKACHICAQLKLLRQSDPSLFLSVQLWWEVQKLLVKYHYSMELRQVLTALWDKTCTQEHELLFLDYLRSLEYDQQIEPV